MIYKFVFGKHIFILHSPFEINWYEWHNSFLKDNIEDLDYQVTHYYVDCYIKEPEVTKLTCLYCGGSQNVYQGSEGEIRVHYLLGNEISIYCEEKKDGYYIWIHPLFKQEAYMYFVAMMLEKVLLKSDALILHSSYLKYKNKAILFTGPSGIGKSTQADLWLEYKKSELINGDRSVLRKINNVWHACGFPICGTSRVAKDANYPIEAIVYLGQDKRNTIFNIKGFEAFQKILSEISVNYWNRKDSEKAIGLIEDICENIPIYYMKCTPTKSAVDCLFKELSDNGCIRDDNAF